LYLKLMPIGGKYWRFNYRFNGKAKTLALGTYPDVSLAKARERHHEARRLLADGVDPSAVKQAVSQDFETVANYAQYLEPRARMMQAWADRLDQLRLQGGA
jgi:hypothetical protein